MHGAVPGDMYFRMFGVLRVFRVRKQLFRELIYRQCGRLRERVYEVLLRVQRDKLPCEIRELWEQLLGKLRRVFWKLWKRLWRMSGL